MLTDKQLVEKLAIELRKHGDTDDLCWYDSKGIGVTELARRLFPFIESLLAAQLEAFVQMAKEFESDTGYTLTCEEFAASYGDHEFLYQSMEASNSNLMKVLERVRREAWEQMRERLLVWFDRFRAHNELPDDVLPIETANFVFDNLRKFVAEAELEKQR